MTPPSGWRCEEVLIMADFVPPAHDSASPLADMRGHHVAVRTPDLESAKRWYIELAEMLG